MVVQSNQVLSYVASVVCFRVSLDQGLPVGHQRRTQGQGKLPELLAPPSVVAPHFIDHTTEVFVLLPAIQRETHAE